jgi:hypothetical protein
MDLAPAVVGLVQNQDEVRRQGDLSRLRMLMQLNRVSARSNGLGMVLAVSERAAAFSDAAHGCMGKPPDTAASDSRTLGGANGAKRARRRHFVRQDPCVPDPEKSGLPSALRAPVP